MKTIKIALLIPTLLLAGCDTNKFLARPENTNLEFWITERHTYDELKEKGCTYLPGWFGASEFLDSRYTALEDEEGETTVRPDVYVTYLLSGYPDTLDKSAVTFIEFNDPLIYVYGLTIESTKEQIYSTMKNNRFKELDSGKYVNGIPYYRFLKNNCVFKFSSTEITIGASSTNKHHVYY